MSGLGRVQPDADDRGACPLHGAEEPFARHPLFRKYFGNFSGLSHGTPANRPGVDLGVGSSSREEKTDGDMRSPAQALALSPGSMPPLHGVCEAVLVGFPYRGSGLPLDTPGVFHRSATQVGHSAEVFPRHALDQAPQNVSGLLLVHLAPLHARPFAIHLLGRISRSLLARRWIDVGLGTVVIALRFIGIGRARWLNIGAFLRDMTTHSMAIRSK